MTDSPIKHVVLLMLENHSFDQMLGCLQSEYPELDGVDVNSDEPRFNLDLSGSKVFQIPIDVQQFPLDPKHESRFVLEQIANGNSGFVTDFQKNVSGSTATDLQNVMGYYLLGRLPALHELATNFTVCDHWFSSLPGPTWPNRFFALTGTSSGRVLMPEGPLNPRLNEYFVQNQITLFDRLTEAGKSWKIYYYDFPSSLLLNRQRLPTNLQRYSRIDNFFQEVNNAQEFPSFVFIEPKHFGADQNDDHPPHNVFKAEKLIADVYKAIRSNPELWESTLLAVVYDEHGGFYDHVVPPGAIPPDEHREEWTFDRLGVRVPAILISPFVGKRVETTVFDHTSFLKYLTKLWTLGSLGDRTASEKTNSIEIAIDQTEPRKDTIPFIRVPYTNLIPERPDLEKEDSSNHHDALHAFATYLAEKEDIATADALKLAAKGAGIMSETKATLGRSLLRFGNYLTEGFEKRNKEMVRLTTDIALRPLRRQGLK